MLGFNVVTKVQWFCLHEKYFIVSRDSDSDSMNGSKFYVLSFNLQFYGVVLKILNLIVCFTYCQFLVRIKLKEDFQEFDTENISVRLDRDGNNFM